MSIAPDEDREEIARLREQIERLQVPICVGKPIIQTLARDGGWKSDDGRAIIAADELFRNDPYAEIERLQAEKASAFKTQDLMADEIERLTAERDDARAAQLTAEKTNAPLLAARADNERLTLENWQLKGALGYPVPGNIPPGPFKCGLCEARALEPKT